MTAQPALHEFMPSDESLHVVVSSLLGLGRWIGKLIELDLRPWISSDLYTRQLQAHKFQHHNWAYCLHPLVIMDELTWRKKSHAGVERLLDRTDFIPTTIHVGRIIWVQDLRNIQGLMPQNSVLNLWEHNDVKVCAKQMYGLLTSWVKKTLNNHDRQQ